MQANGGSLRCNRPLQPAAVRRARECLMLDRQRSASKAAERRRAADRQRRSRQRRRAGESVYRIAVQEAQTIEALLRAARITEIEALRRDRVEQALAELVADFVKRWMGRNRHA